MFSDFWDTLLQTRNIFYRLVSFSSTQWKLFRNKTCRECWLNERIDFHLKCCKWCWNLQHREHRKKKKITTVHCTNSVWTLFVYIRENQFSLEPIFTEFSKLFQLRDPPCGFSAAEFPTEILKVCKLECSLNVVGMYTSANTDDGFLTFTIPLTASVAKVYEVVSTNHRSIYGI